MSVSTIKHALKNQSSDLDISSGQRPLQNGAKYDPYFKAPEHTDTLIHPDGTVEDTVKLIEQVVLRYLEDTKQIAEILKGATLETTLENIWYFLYHHIQYRLDQEGLEQLRRPARSWADRKSGIDCDCFSVFASSILCNLGIPHHFRITKYSQNHWQHIYIIVPEKSPNTTALKKYFTIDAVLSQFNYEKPFTQKMDYPMNLKGIPIAVLSGFEKEEALPYSAPAYHAALLGMDFYEPQKSESEATYKHLLATRQTIAERPFIALIAGYNPPQLVLMLDYLLHYWKTPHQAQALQNMELTENRMNQVAGWEGLSGMNAEFFGADDLYGTEAILGSTNPKNQRNAAAKRPKQFFKKIGAGIQKAGKNLIRYNPATIAARNGFLFALKMNIGKMSSHLKWAYASPAQLKQHHISPIYAAKAQKALQKVLHLFTKIGGNENNLKNAILHSKQGRLEGVEESYLGQLGIAPAAMIAAATPLITAVLSIFKQTGLNNNPTDENGADTDTTIDAKDDNLLPIENTFTETRTSHQQNPYAAFPIEEAQELNGLEGISATVMTFAKNNPMITIGVGGAVLYGLYRLTKPGEPLMGLGKAPIHHYTTQRRLHPL